MFDTESTEQSFLPTHPCKNDKHLAKTFTIGIVINLFILHVYKHQHKMTFASFFFPPEGLRVSEQRKTQ